ncbi:MAG: NAD(P)H-dependent glycerol-3-phosphate dehydrogenase [Paracoccus sp. (in: a-proteobacteria)]|nr:NAD(P)H-dependent glycerol-3-phosphate dehydrogenase [Paracoccus sp. (in: a-proteobacteria)]
MIAVLGAGAFGTALAISLAAKGPVRLWARDPARAGARLPGVALPDAVRVTDSLADLPETVLLAVPAQALGEFLAENAAQLAGRRLVSCAKGIDLATGQGPVAMIGAACPDAVAAVLTGPSFAADIAHGLPTALTLACADAATGEALQETLSTPNLRLYRSTDTVGAELGGALKNIVAIAAGAAVGAGLGDSARASIVTRGFAEMTRFATAKGARAETLAGLSGLGDLVLTCTSDLSRNFRYGRALGRGEAFDPAITVEGAATARAVAALAPKMGVAMPIAQAVAGLASGRLRVQEIASDLMGRPLKEE